MEVEELEKRALSVRNAILATEVESLPIGLQQFPAGACLDASSILGVYFEEQGIECRVVRGRREDGQSKSKKA